MSRTNVAGPRSAQHRAERGRAQQLCRQFDLALFRTGLETIAAGAPSPFVYVIWRGEVVARVSPAKRAPIRDGQCCRGGSPRAARRIG